MNAKKCLTAALVAALATTLAPTASAQPGDGPGPGPGPGKGRGGPMLPRELMERADKDGNGKVTLAELQAVKPDFTAEQFARHDRNGDGVLSPEDRPKGPPPGEGPDGKRGPGGPGGPGERPGGGPRGLRAADANNDGDLTLAEITAKFPDFPKERFAEMDKNGDGVLNQKDRPARPPQGEGPGAGRGDGPGDGPGPGAGRSPRGDGLGACLREADADKDGKTTFEEAKAKCPEVTRERFDRMDRNKDGVLSAEDRPKRPGTPPAPPAEKAADKPAEKPAEKSAAE